MYTDLHFINIIQPVVANIEKALLIFADILRCQISTSFGQKGRVIDAVTE